MFDYEVETEWDENGNPGKALDPEDRTNLSDRLIISVLFEKQEEALTDSDWAHKFFSQIPISKGAFVNKDTSTFILPMASFANDWLLPTLGEGDYWNYDGSLSSLSCFENVSWIIA